MIVNLDDLGNSISEQKREALKPIMAELLECFAYEHVPVSEFLDVLAATIHEAYRGKHGAWMTCVGHLEHAATQAITAERAGELEKVLQEN